MDVIPAVACFILGFWHAFGFCITSSICLPQCRCTTTGFATSSLYPYIQAHMLLSLIPQRRALCNSHNFSSAYRARSHIRQTKPPFITYTSVNYPLYPISPHPPTLSLRTATHKQISTTQQQKTPPKPSTPRPSSPPSSTSDS